MTGENVNADLMNQVRQSPESAPGRGAERPGANGATKTVSKFGIKASLFTAFGAAAALTVAASGIAWFAFAGLGNMLGQVIDDKVPAITRSLLLAKESASIAAAAPALMAVKDVEEKNAAERLLSDRSDRLLALLGEIEATAAVDRASTEEIRGATEQIIGQLSILGTQVEDRLSTRRQRDRLAEGIKAAHEEILQTIVPEIDSANFDLVIALGNASPDLEKNVDLLRDMLEVKAQANLVAGLLREAASAPEEERIQPIRERFIAAVSLLEHSLASLPDSQAGGAVRRAVAALVEFGSADTNIFVVRARELNTIEAEHEAQARSGGFAEALSAHVQALVETAQAQIDAADAAGQTAVEHGKLLLMAVTAVTLVAAVLIAWLYVGRNLIARLVALGDSMRAIAGGNLQAEIPHGGRDEISEMARALVVFRDTAAAVESANRRAEEERLNVAELRRREMHEIADRFEANVAGVVEMVSSAASQLTTTAQSMSGTAEEANRQTSAVASAAEEATASVQTVATAAEEMSGSIEEIVRYVGKSNAIAERAVAQSEETNTDVEGLAEAAERVGRIVDLISGIAGQTNLLALNATIEAARAGEIGKGFAVVASEVKNLANQTAKATEEIAAQIDAMQSATGSAVESIGQISATISEISDISRLVASAMEKQSAATDEIARSAQQAAQGTSHASRNISDVSNAVGETGAASRQVLDAASQLSKESGTLNAEVQKFVSQIRAG